MRSVYSIFAALSYAAVSTAANDSYAIPESLINDTLAATNQTTINMPLGCTCKKSGYVNDELCDQFDCECQCDVTVGACDINCCCDQDCNHDDAFLFSSCLDEGVPSPIVKMCVERPPSLEEVNLQYPLRLSDSPEDKLHGMMCIEKDNSAVKGNFFEDQGYPRATQIFSPGGRGSKQLGFHSYNREATPMKSNANYTAGDPIAVFQLTNNTLTVALGGHLTLPHPDDGGNCIDSNAVSFGMDQTTSCSKNVKNLAVECKRHLSTARYYASYIYVEKTKGSAILGASTQNSMIASGSLLPIRIKTFTDSVGNTSVDLDDMDLMGTQWDDNSSTCVNALKRMTYNILYNHTTIVDISVEIETSNIVGVAAKALQQHFAVNFEPLEAETTKKNEVIPRIRSGNPGYIAGLPTLGATRPSTNHTASYVLAQKAGLTIMDTGVGGQCGTSSPTGSTVGFRNNMVVGCTQLMTRDELRDFCTSNNHPMLASRKVGADHFMYPKWLSHSQDLLGIFGNADPLDRNQWIKIESALDESSFIVKSRSFIDAENRCVGMPSRLRLEILWTYVGNVHNKQAKILSAKRSYEDGPLLQHTLPPNESQPYSFITTVSWTFLPPKRQIVKSPPPLYIFSLPHDVFYPFQMNSAVSAHSIWLPLVGVFVATILLSIA